MKHISIQQRIYDRILCLKRLFLKEKIMWIIRREIGTVVNLLHVEVVLLPRSNQQTPPCPRLLGCWDRLCCPFHHWRYSLELFHVTWISLKSSTTYRFSIQFTIAYLSRYCIFHQCHISLHFRPYSVMKVHQKYRNAIAYIQVYITHM